MDNKLYKLMDWPAIEEIVYSECSHPKRILGGHRVKEGFLIQVFRPDAVQVSVSVSERKKKVQMEKVDDAGFFAALLPLKKQVNYILNIEDKNGIVRQYVDPYSYDDYDTAKNLFNRFTEGTEDKAYELMGGHECEKDGVKGTLFRTWAPYALRVSIVGNFNNWDGRIYQMERITENGIYELFIPGLEAGTEYMYEIKFHGSLTVLKEDPYALEATRQADSHSVVTKKTAAKRIVQNKADTVRNRAGLEHKQKTVNRGTISILEVRLKDIAEITGSDTDYSTMADSLIKYVKKTGYTHIQLMSDSNTFSKKGYSYAAASYYVPVTKYGSSDDFRKFIDKLHAASIGVILEWNGAYFGCDVRGIVNFDGGSCYGYLKPGLDRKPYRDVTTFAYDKGEVRSFLISNLSLWLERYDIDGIRLTDVATMLYLDYGKNPGEWTPNMYGGNENLDAIDFIKQMNAYIHTIKPGAVSIADETSRWPGVTENDEDTSLGFDYKLNDGFAEELREFIKQDPLFRKGVYNKLTYEMFYHYKEHFMTSLAYDALEGASVYELAAGNSLKSRLSDIRAMLGYIYTYPGTKCLSFGNDTGVLMTGEESVKEALERLTDTEYKKMLAYVGRLNELYKSEKALYELDDSTEGFNWIDNYNAAETVLAYERISEAGEKLLIAVNFTPVSRMDYILRIPAMGRYHLLLNSNSADYCDEESTDSKAVVCSTIQKDDNDNYEVRINLPSSGIVIYRYEQYSELEIKELTIKNEAMSAKLEAEKKAQLARELAIKADEEAKRAAEAERIAKESLKLARKARNEAEKKAEEAAKESIRIDEQMHQKLIELKNSK